MTDAELAALRARCSRALTHDIRPTPAEAFAALARACEDVDAFDKYGEAPWLAAFEARVAAELGKAAAVFLPTGTLAQNVAMKIWCDRNGTPAIAFHPASHLEIHESRAYAMLYGLRALLVGSPNRLMTVADVSAIRDPLGAFLVELPQREIGAQLPPWDDLVALCHAARETGAALHLDGARLWESAPFYGRSHAAIAALFDSVYVSFYKGLGAIGGAVLAGDASFIALARVWQHRAGGRPFSIAPIALSAKTAFEGNLGKMAAYRDRAVAFAAILQRFEGVGVVPEPPQTNTFHAYLWGDREVLEARAHEYAREHGTFVFGRLAPSPVPDRHKWEVVAADATLAVTDEEIEAALAFVLRA